MPNEKNAFKNKFFLGILIHITSIALLMDLSLCNYTLNIRL